LKLQNEKAVSDAKEAAATADRKAQKVSKCSCVCTHVCTYVCVAATNAVALYAHTGRGSVCTHWINSNTRIANAAYMKEIP
jgi:hypothetical protein